MNKLYSLLIVGSLCLTASDVAVAAPKAAETENDAVEIVADAPKVKKNTARTVEAKPLKHATAKTTKNKVPAKSIHTKKPAASH